MSSDFNLAKLLKNSSHDAPKYDHRAAIQHLEPALYELGFVFDHESIDYGTLGDANPVFIFKNIQFDIKFIARLSWCYGVGITYGFCPMHRSSVSIVTGDFYVDLYESCIHEVETWLSQTDRLREMWALASYWFPAIKTGLDEHVAMLCGGSAGGKTKGLARGKSCTVDGVTFSVVENYSTILLKTDTGTSDVTKYTSDDRLRKAVMRFVKKQSAFVNREDVIRKAVDPLMDTRVKFTQGLVVDRKDTILPKYKAGVFTISPSETDFVLSVRDDEIAKLPLTKLARVSQLVADLTEELSAKSVLPQKQRFAFGLVDRVDYPGDVSYEHEYYETGFVTAWNKFLDDLIEGEIALDKSKAKKWRGLTHSGSIDWDDFTEDTGWGRERCWKEL
jgi:hypothetical protein